MGGGFFIRTGFLGTINPEGQYEICLYAFARLSTIIFYIAQYKITRAKLTAISKGVHSN